MSFRLAAAEGTLPGETLMEKFAFVQSVGFDGIELSGRGDGIFAARADELRARPGRGRGDADRGGAHGPLHRRLRPRPAARTRSTSSSCC